MLACLPMFAGLKSETLGRLSSATRVLELPGHRSIYSAGQEVQDAHILISGSAKRFVMRSDNVEKVLEFVQPGQMFGLSEVFVGERYVSFAETLRPCVFLAVAVVALREAAKADSAFALRLLTAMAQRLHQEEFDNQTHRSLSGTQRVLDYLLSMAGEARGKAGETSVHLGQSKRLLAARLDMAPETLSRTLRQLSDDGRIVVDGRTIHIQNAPLAVDERAATGNTGTLVRYPRKERGSAPSRLSAVQQVNLCGRQRMLSQQIASTWLLDARGAPAPIGRVMLRKCCAQFERNRERLNSFPWPLAFEPQREALELAWSEVAHVLATVEKNPAGAERMLTLSEQLLLAADQLTKEVAADADSDDARCVNTAGRNRMLCARMTKLLLYCGWGVLPHEILTIFLASKSEFTQNLEILKLKYRSHAEAATQLAVDQQQWDVFLGAVDSSLSAHDRDTALRTHRAGEMLLRHLDATVKMIETLSTTHA